MEMINDSTWIMILRMSGAVALYMLLTAVAFKIWQKGKKNKGMQVLIGLIFGAASVASNHLGIDYYLLVLNVRDIGPLAAGLFFHPLAGIISGLIGGVERYLCAELWGIGEFTKVACSVSTALAGFLAAAMHQWVYKGERPRAVHAFFLGAVMEVFHMYSIIITNRDSLVIANSIIKVCAAPMIFFCAFGLTGCSLVVRVMSESVRNVFRRHTQDEIPLDQQFQRWLLVATVGIFLINFASTFYFEGRRALQEANTEVEYRMNEFEEKYLESDGKTDLNKLLEEYFPTDQFICFIVDESDPSTMKKDYGEGLVLTLTQDDVQNAKDHLGQGGYRTRMNLMESTDLLCFSERIEEKKMLIVVMLESTVYENRDNQIYENTFSDILLFAVLYVLTSRLVELLMVDNLKSVNRSLRRITGGDLNEEVYVRSSAEFTELSGDINKTVTTLKGYIQAAEKRMEQELKLATTIQEASLPRVFTFPRKDFEVYALMHPAKEVGGDFYDFFFIDNNLLVLVIADVSGKGVPAALFMMRAKTAIKNMAQAGHSPASLLQRVNNTLCEGNDAEMFVTVWIGIIDLTTGRMNCANAGHEYPVIKRVGQDWELLKDKHGLALAAMENIPMKEYELQMNPGDKLFVYTDGAPEAINEKQEAYGTERMVAALNRIPNASQEVTLQGVLRDLRNFVQAADQFDDITMLGFTYFGQGQEIDPAPGDAPAEENGGGEKNG